MKWLKKVAVWFGIIGEPEVIWWSTKDQKWRSIPKRMFDSSPMWAEFIKEDSK